MELSVWGALFDVCLLRHPFPLKIEDHKNGAPWPGSGPQRSLARLRTSPSSMSQRDLSRHVSSVPCRLGCSVAWPYRSLAAPASLLRLSSPGSCDPITESAPGSCVPQGSGPSRAPLLWSSVHALRCFLTCILPRRTRSLINNTAHWSAPTECQHRVPSRAGTTLRSAARGRGCQVGSCWAVQAVVPGTWHSGVNGPCLPPAHCPEFQHRAYLCSERLPN